jgi:ATP-binding cassette subfamily C protein CydD
LWRSTSASPISARWFGHYGTAVTLSAGFLALILARIFSSLFAIWGPSIHAKAQAVGAADSLKTFLETPLAHPERGDMTLNAKEPVTVEARVFHPVAGRQSAGRPAELYPARRTARGARRHQRFREKFSAECAIRFMAYTGSLRINKTELRDLHPDAWRKQLSWVGQNRSFLPPRYVKMCFWRARMRVKMNCNPVLDRAWVSEFLPLLPQGVRYRRR